jgi:hypothetical protein
LRRHVKSSSAVRSKRPATRGECRA